MRTTILLAILVAMTPLAGCLHTVTAAGVPTSVLDDGPWELRDARTETQAGVAKVEVRVYDRSDATSGYAALTIVTVPDIPVLTAQAVDAAAEQALADMNANVDGTTDVTFSGAGAGTVAATKFTVEQDGQEGTGFRAEFSCDDGYVVALGFGADAPLVGFGGSMFDAVVTFADEVTCDGGDGQAT